MLKTAGILCAAILAAAVLPASRMHATPAGVAAVRAWEAPASAARDLAVPEWRPCDERRAHCQSGCRGRRPMGRRQMGWWPVERRPLAWRPMVALLGGGGCRGRPGGLAVLRRVRLR